MRCLECNIDLPETYSRCPLCNAKTDSVTPLLENIETAEFPIVKTQPQELKPLPIFFIAWGIVTLTSALLLKNNLLSTIEFSLFFSSIPLIWTLLIRPLKVKQLTFANNIVMNFYSLNLLLISYGIAAKKDHIYYMLGLPCIVLVLILLLNIYNTKKPKKEFRTAVYIILLVIYCLIAGIVSLIIFKSDAFMWSLPILYGSILLVIIYLKNPSQTKNEIKAKFSIQ